MNPRTYTEAEHRAGISDALRDQADAAVLSELRQSMGRLETLWADHTKNGLHIPHDKAALFDQVLTQAGKEAVWRLTRRQVLVTGAYAAGALGGIATVLGVAFQLAHQGGLIP